MNKRDKIIEILDDCAEVLEPPNEDTYIELDERKVILASYAKDILALDDWVSVEDRLPITEEMMSGTSYMDKEVIICTRDGSVYTCLFEAGNTVDFWYGFKGYYEGYITHWQPLPEPKQ